MVGLTVLLKQIRLETRFLRGGVRGGRRGGEGGSSNNVRANTEMAITAANHVLKDWIFQMHCSDYFQSIKAIIKKGLLCKEML